MLTYLQEYVTEISKYIIAMFMALYTLESFLVFNHRIKRKNGIYTRQSLYLFIIQFLMFVDLALVSRNKDYVFFYAFVQVFIFVAVNIVPLIYEKCDRLLLNHMCMLLGVGFCMISRLSFQKALKQYVIVIGSLALGMFIPLLLNRFTFWKKLIWLYAAIGILLLGGVLILGEVTHGSKISFTVHEVTFQPSEFVKILFVFFVAAALCENTSFQRIAVTSVLAGIQVLILVVSKDLGSALIFFVAYLFLVVAASKDVRYLLAGLASGCLAAVAAYFIFDHVKVRVLAWQDPWAYIDDQGYQITQSLFAIGSGSWFGMGLYQGNPAAIPYVAADFIFSAVCEELGVVFGVCLILVCLSCFVRMMDIAVRQKDRFYQLLASGLGIMYIFQIFLTVGGGVKFIPLTGVTLPLVSYGGSSVMTTMILFFMIQAVSMRDNKKEGVKHVVEKESEASKAKGEQKKSSQ